MTVRRQAAEVVRRQLIERPRLWRSSTLYGALAALVIIAALFTVCAVAIDGPSAAGDHVSRPNVLHLKLDK